MKHDWKRIKGNYDDYICAYCNFRAVFNANFDAYYFTFLDTKKEIMTFFDVVDFETCEDVIMKSVLDQS